jgi:type VI secretion system protein VasD
MKRVVAVLSASLLLAGCSTVGNVLRKTGQVLMDPSIQVGSAGDQPTQIALSLYASPDVNPNAQLNAPTELVPATNATPEPVGWSTEDGPFVIRLQSQSRAGLEQSLQALLDNLRTSPDVGPVQPVRPILPKHLATPGATHISAKPDARWPRSMAMEEDVPLPLAGLPERESNEPDEEPLGQYRKDAGIPAPVSVTTASTMAASPIAFKLLQLKDDSMLENTTPEQVRENPKKALGSTFVSADDYVLVPGQFKFIDYAAIDEKTRYIAVIAAFNDPDAERWHHVFRLEPVGRKYALLVTLQGTRATITDESFRPAPAATTTFTPTRTSP